MYDVVIIGGGASGLMLAARMNLNMLPDASDRREKCGSPAGDENSSGAGHCGLILEGSQALGTKLLMSGGGRCNITHGGSIKDFVSCYGDAGPRLRKCLYKHSNIELAAWLEENDINLADEKGRPIVSCDLEDAGRVFPASHRASDILDLLKGKAISNGWEIRTGNAVYGLKQCSNAAPDGSAISDQDGITTGRCIWEIRVAGYEDYTPVSYPVVSRHESKAADNTDEGSKDRFARIIYASNVVIASGGITFPETGANGSMFTLLDDLGVNITNPRSALAPVYVKDYPYEELSGISIPAVTVSVRSSIEHDAHNCDCSGTAAEPQVQSGKHVGDATHVSVHMTGDLLFTHRGFSGPVILNISRYAQPGSVLTVNYNADLEDLPRRMQRCLEKRSAGPSGDVKSKVLSGLLSGDGFTVDHVDDNGMVTAGGISLDEIDMKTMELRRFPGLYVIGETIDADGITGGYNLQMCWSTANTAADHILAK